MNRDIERNTNGSECDSILYKWYLRNYESECSYLLNDLYNKYGKKVVDDTIEFGCWYIINRCDWVEDELKYYINESYYPEEPTYNDYIREELSFFNNQDLAFRASIIGGDLISKAISVQT